uniref:Myb/SANT-like DNA-binding domain-containing protein n=1 Tax=Oryzias latipes TaxID=8090 RepID=A0A3P9KH07_ORYLA
MAERGYRRSWLQCQRKIKSLRAKYKEVKDWNKRSGRQHITCPFYKELDRILGYKPSVQPLELLDSWFGQEEPEEESADHLAVAASDGVNNAPLDSFRPGSSSRHLEWVILI